MKLTLLCALSLMLLSRALPAEETSAITPQAMRGRELFTNSPKGTSCGTCHLMAGVGTAIGPDLRKIAAYVGPRGLVMTIEMTMTAYVQEVKTSVGGSFPGIQKQKDGDELQIWDLSKMPPVLRTLHSGDIASMRQNDKWKHPPTSAGYTPQELADIIGFLKWASTGSQKEVAISEIPVK